MIREVVSAVSLFMNDLRDNMCVFILPYCPCKIRIGCVKKKYEIYIVHNNKAVRMKDFFFHIKTIKRCCYLRSKHTDRKLFSSVKEMIENVSINLVSINNIFLKLTSVLHKKELGSKLIASSAFQLNKQEKKWFNSPNQMVF